MLNVCVLLRCVLFVQLGRGRRGRAAAAAARAGGPRVQHEAQGARSGTMAFAQEVPIQTSYHHVRLHPRWDYHLFLRQTLRPRYARPSLDPLAFLRIRTFSSRVSCIIFCALCTSSPEGGLPLTEHMFRRYYVTHLHRFA